MTVRIQVTSEGSMAVVRVAGRLVSQETAELRRICPASGGEFVLDLSDLLSADPEGIAVIRALVRDGAKLRGLSPFIRLLLAEDGD